MRGRMGAQQMGGRIGALNGSPRSMAPLARRRIASGITSDDVSTSRMSCVTSCPQAMVVDSNYALSTVVEQDGDRGQVRAAVA